MAYYNFTKTSFVRGVQCEKLVFLDKYRKSEATPPDAETREKFNKGFDFERNVKNAFVKDTSVEAIDMKTSSCRFWERSYSQKTLEILNSKDQCVVFEAGLFYEQEKILVLSDILRKNSDCSYEIFEVKHCSTLNTAIEWDLAIQYYVSKRVLGNIKNFNVVLRKVDSEIENDFEIINKLDFVKSREQEVEKYLRNFEGIQNGPEPRIEMGEQCNKPYKCNFQEYCLKHKNL